MSELYDTNLDILECDVLISESKKDLGNLINDSSNLIKENREYVSEISGDCPCPCPVPLNAAPYLIFSPL